MDNSDPFTETALPAEGRRELAGHDNHDKSPRDNDDQRSGASIDQPTNVLFVCARNQWRSPTAANIFKNRPEIEVRSVGLSPRSPRTINAQDLAWADMVIVMEHEHVARVKAAGGHGAKAPPIRVLDVPDEHGFMDPRLISELEHQFEAILNEIL